MIAERLEGSWSLVAYEEFDQEDRATYPLGTAPVGVILYTVDGRMSAQIMNRKWAQAPANRADAYFVAYSGRYVVNEAGDTVAHHIEVSAIPSWLGTVQERSVHFDDDGTLALTSTAPVRTPSGIRMVRLRWARFASSGPIVLERDRA